MKYLALALAALAQVSCSADNLLETTLRENIAARQGAVIGSVNISNAYTSTTSTQNTATVSFQLSESGKYSVVSGSCDSGFEIVGRSSADAGSQSVAISSSSLSSGANNLKICFWEPVRSLLSDSYAVVLYRDDAAPTIVSSVPANNAVRADTDTNVTVVFSEPVVLPADIATGIAVTNNQGSVAGNASLNSSGETLTFQPTTAFGYTKNIQVQILAGFTDRAGNAVAATTLRFATKFTIQAGTLGSDMANGLAIDGSDNLYVVGTAEGSLYGETYQTGARDAFLIKYDSYGQRTFTRMISSSSTLGSGNDSFQAVLLDASGNIFTTGLSFGASTVTFDGIAKFGSNDAFLMKYASDGTKISTHLVGSTSTDSGEVLVSDASGNIYLIGMARQGVSIDGLAFTGSDDILIQKFDSAGTKLFTKLFGTTASDSVTTALVDNSGNLYIGGNSQGAFVGTNSDGNSDIFLMKFDSSGNEIWRRQINNPGLENVREMVFDNSGNLWLCGYATQAFDGNATFGNNDMILTKYQSDGTKLFSRQFGTAYSDSCEAIAKDSSGNLFIAGNTAGDLVGTNNDVTNSTSDILLARIDLNGNFIWQKQYGGSANDDVFALKLNSQNHMFVTGRTTSNLDGNTLLSASKFDFYLMKFDNSGNLQ